MTALKAALSTVQISDVLSTRAPQGEALVSIESTDTIESAMSLLAEHNILSVPVFSSGRCDGIIDMNHIMAYMCKQLAKNGGDIGKINLRVPVTKAVDNSKFDPLLTASPETPILDLLKFFAGGYSHRAVVGHNPTTICSQSDVVTLLAKISREDPPSNPKLAEVFAHPAYETVMGQSCHLRSDRKEGGGVTTVKPDDSLLTAMQLLHRDSVSAAAVVDSQNKIVGNFSSSDLRGLKPDDLGILNEEVREYLLKKSGRFYPIAIDKNTSLAETLQLMADSRIHRVWVVEDLTHPFPFDLITMSDIIKFIVNQHE